MIIMPDHKSHKALGIAIWIVLLVYLLMSYPDDLGKVTAIGLTGFVLIFLGSILPDVDEKSSHIFRHVRFLIFAVVFVISYAVLYMRYPGTEISQIIYLLAICMLISLAAVFFFYAIVPPHRQGIHSVWAGVVYFFFCLAGAYVLLYEIWASVIVAAFGFLAYISHLVLDRSIK